MSGLTPLLSLFLYAVDSLPGLASARGTGSDHVGPAFLSLFPSLKYDLASADILAGDHLVTYCGHKIIFTLLDCLQDFVQRRHFS